MAAINAIPASRVSDLLVQQRLLGHMRTEEAELLRLQTTISTGRRIAFPSEDAPAALRAIELQRLLERKAQLNVNLQTNQSYLSATDTALSSIGALVADVRGTVLSVTATTSTDIQREAAAIEVDRALQQLVETANQKFRGRYLFAGSQTDVLPFELSGNYVRYNGNESLLQSYADINQLFDTNVPGAKVFGGLSQPVLGSTDLNPALRPETRLADLRGGLGISGGSIAISDGTTTSIVDVSGAETIGDVAALLEAQPPAGRTVTVHLTSTGINVELDAPGGGQLTIIEVGGGTTVRELGIFHEVGSGTGPVIGSDLNPRLTLTTPVRTLLGVSAQTVIRSLGDNNNFILEAKQHGAAFNGWTLSFIDDNTVIAGGETVAYDTLAKTITVNIESGATTADQVLSALNGDAGFSADWDVRLDPEDPDNDGSGLVDLSASGATTGGSGIEFDQASGLQILNAGNLHTIDLSSAQTVEDLLNLLNGSQAQVLASINEAGTGINIRSRLSGVDFAIGENGGATAAQLGLRSFTENTRLNDLNHGLGVHSVPGVDFAIRRKDGIELEINVSGAQTIGDVLALINNHPANADPLTKVTARLAAFGNGIELVTGDTSSAAEFAVLGRNFSQAAQDLGLIPVGADRSPPATVSGSVEIITGSDSNPIESEGILNTLLRMRQALRANDVIELDRTLAQIDEDLTHLNFVRAEVGARQQSIDNTLDRLASEEIDLQAALSQEIDVDLASAISEFVARQAGYEAALQMIGRISQLTLLNFL